MYTRIEEADGDYYAWSLLHYCGVRRSRDTFVNLVTSRNLSKA